MTTIKKQGFLAGMVLGLVSTLLIGLVAVAIGVQATGNRPGGTPPNSSGFGGMMGSGPLGANGGPGGVMGGIAGPPTDPNAPRRSSAQIQKVVTDYLATYYPGQNLTIGEIMEFQNNFYAQIREPATGKSAFELLIDPYNGNPWPEYGPNMMWNTKYGLMAQAAAGRMGGGMMGGGSRNTTPTTDMPVTAQQAVQSAQQYLDAQALGLTAESQPDIFYGYYTLHSLKGGQIIGMLSVNGYTGQVWYHTWHGPFVAMAPGQ